MEILSKNNFFFIGVGGAGMSAIAQYLSGIGKNISGSDRLFLQKENDFIKEKLEAEHIKCFLQDGSGINENTEIVVASTAIEDSNLEIQKAKELGIEIVFRSDLLAAICASKKTIALAGTSGKSTTTAMLFHILFHAGVSPSMITGAGIINLIQEGKIGNAYVGNSDYLLIEADESDGSLVKYKAAIGVLLNMDKDHKELSELEEIFETFKQHTTDFFIVNQSNEAVKKFSNNKEYDFGKDTKIDGKNFSQHGFSIRFQVQDEWIEIPTIGEHNMQNALACIAAAKCCGVSLLQCKEALKSYPGIYRRHQLLGSKKEVLVIDDYAHNPAKIAASIKACQPVGDKLIAWFQPHGFGPTRFIRKELVEEITAALRPQDEIWMSEIYYAGGTAEKNISANDIINDLKNNNVNAFFVEDRNILFQQLLPTLKPKEVLLLMGARDPSLEHFGKEIFELL